MDLASDLLDVDGLPSLAAANLIGDLDLSLSLRAGSLHIARVGETQIDSGSLALNLAKSGPNVTLKRLSVAGLDGASFDVEGATGPELDFGDGSLASRPAARFRSAGFAGSAQRLESNAGRASG